MSFDDPVRRDDESPEPPRTPRIGRRILFMFGAVLAGLAPIVALETALRLFDVGRPTDQPDPSAGFNRSLPLFERQGAVYRTTRAHAPCIAPQEFAAAKPRDGFRIFCFGGSTVYGHPYLGDTAFPKWLELELAGCEPARAWEVINCGGISYASYRIAPLVREVLQYQPDLIILATGHNEFLEDRTYHAIKSRAAGWAWMLGKLETLRTVAVVRSWVGRGAAGATGAAPEADVPLRPNVNTRLDNASGYASYHRDDAWHESVAAQFDDAVRTMVADCQAAHVPILLVRLGSNLRDCPPFKSEHRAGLAPELEAQWQAAFDLAAAVEKADPRRALEWYREAATIDPEYALLNYRIARLLDRSGRRAEARPFFEKARDEDICPLRIVAPLERTLARIATETHAPLVDAAALLAARSPDGIPGYDWYLDHVHPTIGGHQLIARALAARMREAALLARSPIWPEAKRTEAYARHFAELSPTYFADGRRRIGWLEAWAQRQRLAAEMVPVDAAGYMRRGFRRLDLGDDAAASEALHEARKRDATTADLIRAHAQRLIAEGRAERAAALLREVH